MVHGPPTRSTARWLWENLGWYASTQMLIQWRRRKMLQTESALPDPSEVPATDKLYTKNRGITDKQVASSRGAWAEEDAGPPALLALGTGVGLRY